MSISTRGPVVVVDDDPAILHALTSFLDLEGFRVEQATNGAEALEVIARVFPAIVFLDLQLPDLDGGAVVHELRAREIPVPIVLMSGDPSLERRARELRVAAFLHKPFGASQILPLLTNWLVA
jgi:DNA-binding response OmpR family regulator